MANPDNYSFSEDKALKTALSPTHPDSIEVSEGYELLTPDFVEQTSIRIMERLGIESSGFTIPFSEIK